MGSVNSIRSIFNMDRSDNTQDTPTPNNSNATAPEDDQETGEQRTGSSASGSNRNREMESDLTTILSMLIRSGQVRLLTSDNLYGDDDDDDRYMFDDDIEDDFMPPRTPPGADRSPDTSCLDKSELKMQISMQSGQCCGMSARYQGQRQGHSSDSSDLSNPGKRTPICKLLQMREVGVCGKQNFSPSECCVVNSYYLPNHKTEMARYMQKAFCGTYSQDGNIFLSACQDRKIRIYDTTCGQFRKFKHVSARDVGWSVLDTAFSPDGNYLIYSSWSDCIHLCNIHGEHETHDSLPLQPESENSFCIFSVCFSQDNVEILGGANDGCLYVYDREKNGRTLRILAHDDDINAVSFADNSSQILFSGADDGLVKVWDRRALSESRPVPVGVLAGHSDGITFIDSKGDARYLVSNSKDQTIKLWDIRKFSTKDAQRATQQAVANQKWDYRWQQVPSKVVRRAVTLDGDTSLMTYRGHSVLNTLIRCRFSPAHMTGQRYIYSGCATGAVIVYDVLTGQIVTKLKGHKACVRDVSWHPYENKILSTSWDTTVGEWSYFNAQESSDEEEDEDDDSDQSDDGKKRRSTRLKEIRQKQRTSGRRLFARLARD